MSDSEKKGPVYGQLSGYDKALLETALKRGATRREVMGWLIASGATIASAGSIVTAAGEALAQTPKKGGKIKIAYDLHGPSDTLDPILFTSSIDYGRGRAHFDNLVRLNDDLSTGPDLAEEYSSNKDATEWTFKLRKGVKWHDGKPLTAEDVIYSMNRHLGKDSKSKAKPLVEMVKEWKKVDATTVKAILSSPNADLAAALGTFHFRILQDGTTDFSSAVGTGPFKLKLFQPGVKSVHVRNDDYWGGPANLEEVEIFAITDTAARLNALLAGNVDMIGNLSPKNIPEVESNPNVEPWSVPSGAYMDIVARVDRGPGKNPDFVRALKHLQRRDRFVKIVMRGQGTVGSDNPINEAYSDYCADAPTFGYDPDKAKSLLKKSGVSGAELYVAEVGPGLTDICQTLQRECAKAGFKLNLKKVPNDGYWGAIWLKKDMYVSSWNMRPTANVMMSLAYKSDAKWNESYWKSEEFDKLLLEARATTDANLRKEIYCKLQTLITEGSGTIVPVHRNYVEAKSKKLKGVGRLPLAIMNGFEWGPKAWLDA
ncbi:MAG: ABC transporter substrate-binding protein [Hyphomicrobiaceae bacterium]